MKKIKSIVVALALSLTLATISNVNAQEKIEYKKSGYIISENEANEMIKKYERLVQSTNDKAPDDKYIHFMGYDRSTCRAITP